MNFGCVGFSLDFVAPLLVEPMSIMDTRWDLNPVLVNGFADA